MRNLLLGFFLSFSVLADTFIAPPALYEGFNAVTSSAGSTQLTKASETVQVLTGTTTETYLLPDATTLKAGRRFDFVNSSTGVLTVHDFAGGAVGTVAASSSKSFYNTSLSTSAGSWVQKSGSGGGSVSIGAPVTGGSAGDVLFVDGSTNLAQSINLFYDISNTALNVGSSASTSANKILSVGVSQNAETAIEARNASNGASAKTSLILTSSAGSPNLSINSSTSAGSGIALPNTLALNQSISNGLLAIGATSGASSLIKFYVGGATDSNKVADFENGKSLRLYNSAASFSTGIKSLAALAASYTLTLPPDAGAANQFLTTDGSGVLTWTTPGAATSVGAHVFIDSTDQTITSATWTKLNLNAVFDDSNSAFDTGSNRFVVPLSGTSFWDISAHISHGGGSEQWHCALYKNGSGYLYGYMSNTSMSNGSDCSFNYVKATANTDYFEIFVFQDSGSNRTVFANGGGAGADPYSNRAAFELRADGSGGGGGSGWGLTGNALGNDTSTLGSTDAHKWALVANGVPVGRFYSDGGVSFGNNVSALEDLAPGIITFSQNQVGSTAFSFFENKDATNGSSALLGVIAGDNTNSFFQAFPSTDSNKPSSLLIASANKIYLNPNTSGPSGQTISTQAFVNQQVTVGSSTIDWSLGNDFYVALLTATINPAVFTNQSDGEEITILVKNDTGGTQTVDIPNTVLGYSAAGFPLSLLNGKYFTFKVLHLGGVDVITSFSGPY